MGLRDPKVQEQVIRKDPRTYFAALQAAQNELAVTKQVAHYQVGDPMSQDLGPVPMDIGSLQATKAIQKPSTKVIRQEAALKNSKEYPPCPVDGKTNHPIERCYLLRKMKTLYLDQVKSEQRTSTRSTTGKSKMPTTSKPTQSGSRRRKLLAALLEEMDRDDLLENEEDEEIGQEQTLENEILDLEDNDADLHALLGNPESAMGCLPDWLSFDTSPVVSICPYPSSWKMAWISFTLRAFCCGLKRMFGFRYIGT